MYLSACLFRFLILLVGLTGITLQIIRKGDFLGPFVTFTVQSSTFVTLCFAVVAWATFRKRDGLPPAIKGAAVVYILITGLVYNLVLAGQHRPGELPPGPPPAMAGDNQPTGTPPPGVEAAPPQLPGPPRSDEGGPPSAAAHSRPAFLRFFPHPGLLLHILLPIMVLADWLIFDPHRRYHWRYAVLWLVYPFAYIGFILMRHAIFPNTGFPYPFVDVDRIGYNGLALNVVLYGVAFYVLGLLIVGVDRLLPSRGNDDAQKEGES